MYCRGTGNNKPDTNKLIREQQAGVEQQGYKTEQQEQILKAGIKNMKHWAGGINDWAGGIKDWNGGMHWAAGIKDRAANIKNRTAGLMLKWTYLISDHLFWYCREEGELWIWILIRNDIAKQFINSCPCETL